VADGDRLNPESVERRVVALEAEVRALTLEVIRLKGAREGERVSAGAVGEGPSRPSGAPHPPHPMAPRSPLTVPSELQPANWLPKQLDLESLVGRYGTLVLATVSALAAVGTFLGWAIANGLLGPSQRIALGLLVAAGLAVGGLRLRRRERSFGASLLGLSLAITHVCAWGAGPSLHLVPDWGAFLLAAVASIALAIFAHAEADEPLWSVGFSGAAIAPFVTASGKSDLLLLTAYGIAVLASSGYAMGSRSWVIAGRLFLLAAALYTAALATGFERHFGPLLAMGFPLVVAITGVIPWIGGAARGERLRALGALATVAAVRSGMGMNLPLEKPAIAALIASAGVVWLVIVDRTHTIAGETPSSRRWLYEGDWLDGGVLPLGFVGASVMALDTSVHGSGLAMAAAAAVLLIAVMRFPEGSLRDAAVFATVLCALVADLLLAKGRPFFLTGSIALLSAVCFAANRVWRSVSWTTLGTIGLAWAVLAALGHLINREPYRYAPFVTEPSAVAAVVLASILAAWRLARREQQLERLLRSASIGWAFLWIHQEIAFALNPTAATLFRVSYYAVTSVVAVGQGRARHVPILRHIGLALAILAAGTALYGARKLDAIAARIGADLVAAVFLLAIAYWYRKPGVRTASSQV
jgi:hypothetical protein